VYRQERGNLGRKKKTNPRKKGRLEEPAEEAVPQLPGQGRALLITSSLTSSVADRGV